MKLRLFRLALVFVALFVIGACSSNDNNNNEENNNNEQEEEQNENNDNENEENNDNDSEEMISVDFEDITFSYPGDLEEMSDLDDSEMPSVGYEIDQSSGTSLNIIAEYLPAEITLDDYMELAMENFDIEYDEEQDISINDIEMQEYRGVQDDIPVIQRMFIHNKTAYIITYGSSNEENLKEYEPVLDEITETIELNEVEDNESDNDNDSDEMASVDFEDISFSYPSNLEELPDMDEDDTDMPAIGYFIDMMTGTSFNMIAEPLPDEDLTLDEYVEMAMDNYGLEYDEEEKISMNDIDMYELQGYQDDMPMIQIIFVHNETAYILTYGSLDEETFSEHQPVFEEIVETIELN